MAKRKRGSDPGGSTEIVRLPMPDRIEPKSTKRTLMTFVRIYFTALFNGNEGDMFKGWLGSVGNKDAKTGNRLFDRYEAVNMVKQAAVKADDEATAKAKPGDIYQCITHLLRENGMGLKLRRQQYEQLTHMKPAE
jgi:hypothetical protein